MDITNFRKNPSYENGNKGGLQSFRFCPVEWVDVMPMVADGAYLTTITFVATRGWLTGYASKDTLLWDEEPQGGNLYKPVLKGFCPTDEKVNLALFELMKGKQFLVLAKDMHDREVLCGKPDSGLIFSFKRGKGNRGNNHHGQDFEFGGVALPWPGYYY